MKTTTVRLDGYSLTIDALMLLGTGNCRIELTEEAITGVREARKVIDALIAKDETIYGVNTGFGLFSTVRIEKDQICQLQKNLITSHSAAIGDPLSLEATRRMMALRINTLSKGYSGIRYETLQQVIDAFNNDCLPYIPMKGTVGASGDLCHLSHLALGLLGDGLMWDVKDEKYAQADDVLKKYGLVPLDLHAKEGLALINGTQFITGVGIEALAKARNLVLTADYVTAFTASALRATEVAFFPEIHQTRPHPGQIFSAHNIRHCMHSTAFRSEIREKYPVAVQDAYSIRCAPQVHGIVHDTIQFVSTIITTEINSATDNPMIFSDNRTILSGGNFHGEYPAKALDYLTIATHELGSISERRIERLMNSNLNGGLPWFLVKNGGMNSGFMISHCTAASLVAENKSLCFPASVDSISTSAAKEDHVSMGGWAARKAVQVVKNVEYILAIELLSATQAYEFLRPEKTTAPLEAVYKLVREHVAPLLEDRVLSTDIEKVVKLIRDGSVIRAIEQVLIDGGVHVPHYEATGIDNSNLNITNNHKHNHDHHHDHHHDHSKRIIHHEPMKIKIKNKTKNRTQNSGQNPIIFFAAGIALGIIGYNIVTRFNNQ